MLYDPKWEKQAETKTNPLSMEALVAWLEAKPADGDYNYHSNGDCLLCQFLKHAGYEAPRAGGDYWRPDIRSDEKHFLAKDVQDVLASFPWTYGAALERARAALR